ncbi:TIGR02646 family protein [Pseudomonas syringae]|uniref:retron system putative HNH endonuclease n=1 Tax=Pseudomonas syringae TaxID=317 RepID=UPI00215B5765|nr:retron system putative HNH endonuclease [Pseudomonas syringae]MCR8720444.1 TIGR02646 family protein [Pseudomonas syringae]
MRKIEKGSLVVLEQWTRSNKGKKYADLTDREDIKDAIRHTCVREQHGLCAYCCRRITLEKTSAHNEHIEAQSLAPNRTLDFQNIVASCNQPGQCGKAHGHQLLRLTPLMVECEAELQFELSGLVAGKTERAQDCIKVLNLGGDQAANRGLIGERKAMINTLLYPHGMDASGLSLEGDDLLDLLHDELLLVDESQQLQAFSPALINVIRRLKALQVY